MRNCSRSHREATEGIGAVSTVSRIYYKEKGVFVKRGIMGREGRKGWKPVAETDILAEKGENPNHDLFIHLVDNTSGCERLRSEKKNPVSYKKVIDRQIGGGYE